MREIATYEVLIDTVRRTMAQAWQTASFGMPKIESWLSNFDGTALLSDYNSRNEAKEVERKLALFLLCNFVYFNESEVRHLLKNLCEKYIHHVFFSEGKSSVTDTEIKQLINNTLFSSLGNQSESSSYLLYTFRQVNDLSKRDFDNSKEYSNLVFIDDFSISGKQASRYIKKYKNKMNTPQKTYVLLMIATMDAINEIKKANADVIVISSVVLDESSKPFSQESIVFKDYNPLIKNQAEKMCRVYGALIKGTEKGANELGFGGYGYLLGTYYNTPNNTLPIFWSEENSWKPLFKRYEKVYSDSKSSWAEGHYV